MDLKDLPENGLIDFYATWCTPCSIMEPIVDNIMEDGIAVIRIDVEENVEIAQYFQIMSIPTFVVMEDGKEKNRITGTVSEAKLRSLI